MLDIFKVSPILKKYPLDIECIHAFDDYLLVGTKQGHLLMYKLIPKSNANYGLKFDVHLQRSNKSFAKKPIVQIAAIPDFNIIISLSDSVVSVHRLDQISSPLISCINKTKGATLFIVHIGKSVTLTGENCKILRMCCVVRKRLMLFYWKNNDFEEYPKCADLIVVDVPRAIAWCSESLCVGFKSDYTIIKVTGEQKDLFPTGKYPEPIIASLEGNRLALGRDENTYIIDSEGYPILKYPIVWSDLPISLADDSPYLVALLPASIVEIRTIETRLFIQKIDLSSVTTSKIKLLVPYVNKKGYLFAASNNDVVCLVSIPLQQQIPQLLNEKQFELALELANMLEDACSVPNEEEQESNDTTDCSQMNKAQIIHKIEYLHAFDLFCTKEFNESMNLFLKLDTDPSLVIGLFPVLLPEDYRSKIEYPTRPVELQGTDLEKGLFSLIDYLVQIRRKLYSNSNGEVVSESSKSSSSQANTVTKAHDQLCQIVDTTLLKCYLQTNDALVSSLLRLPDNHCHLEETERALIKFNKYNELIILYQSKDLHKRALDLLYKQSKKVDSPLCGYERTIQYLQHLGQENLELIFKYASWVLKEHPDDGLRIFIEDVGHDTEQLPREIILNYLQTQNSDLVIPYLENVIHNWKDTSSVFHNTLVHKYREKVRVFLAEYLNSLPEAQSPTPAGEEPGELGVLRKKLLSFLETSDYYATETLLTYLLNDGLFEERAVVMGKIRNHEEALTIYVHVLENLDKAEDYCNKMYDKTVPGNRDVYLILLKLYISVKVSSSSSADCVKQQYLDAAIRLLSKHATKIDPLRALLLLPVSIPIKSIKDFLENVTKYIMMERHEGQVYRNLLLAQHLQVQHQRIKLQQAHKIVVDEHDLCRVCQRRIGKSAFLRFPNQDLVHYSCKDKYNAH